MIVDFTAQAAPLVWAIIAALFILALAIFASIEPELAEVYLSDVQLLVATLALAAIAVVMLSAGVEARPRLGTADGDRDVLRFDQRKGAAEVARVSGDTGQ